MKIKDLIIVNVAILALFFLLTGTTPLNPKGEVFERRPTFEWLGLPTTYVILIDDNPDFSTPITARVKGKTYAPKDDLALGDHYWKVKGLRDRAVQTFSITSKVSLKKEEEDIRNDGNTRLRLGIKPGASGLGILDINQTVKLDKTAQEVAAKQDE